MLALIVAGGAVLRLVFFTGYHGYDDVFYIQRAVELAGGHAGTPTTHWGARLGLVLPTALAYRLLGISPASTVVFPFTCSLLSVVAAGVLGRRLQGARAGLLAAALVAFFPMDVLFASMLFPTAPVGLFCGVGLATFALAERDRRPSLYLLSGASVGLAGLAHEAALVVLVVYPVHALVCGRPHLRQLYAALALAVVLLLDPLAHGVLGDPAAHLAVLAHASSAQGTASDVAYSGLNFSWLAEPVVRLFTERTFGLFPFLAVPIVALRLVRPAGASDRTLALLVAVGFLWITYGSVSPRVYAPLSRLPRYLAPVMLPALLLLAVELDRVSARVRAWLLALLATTSVLCLLLDSGSALPAYRALRETLAAERPARVVIERDRMLPLLLAEGYAPAYQLEPLGDLDPHDALVVVASPGARARLEAAPGATLIARIAPPETLYGRLLGAPVVTRILRLVRPAARLDEYAERLRAWELSVYRLP